MSHSTAEHINGIVDAIINRLEAAEESLVPEGQTLTVIEGDEEPQYIKALPSIYVIPLGEGGDTISMSQDYTEEGMVHNFSTTIIGFYRYKDITSGIRPTRTFAYNALDLFVGENQVVTSYTSDGTMMFGAATIDSTKVKIGYRRDKDFVVHAWILTLNQIGA